VFLSNVFSSKPPRYPNYRRVPTNFRGEDAAFNLYKSYSTVGVESPPGGIPGLFGDLFINEIIPDIATESRYRTMQVWLWELPSNVPEASEGWYDLAERINRADDILWPDLSATRRRLSIHKDGKINWVRPTSVALKVSADHQVRFVAADSN
jgi:hypothetical protein